MSKTHTVSVVIPVYNGSRFITTAIQSALSQSNSIVEVIAVDDGSTDNSLGILNEFRDEITIISQSNAGVAAARNSGMKAAKGEYIAFLDQDDYWDTSKVEKQVALFKSNKRIGLIHTGVKHIKEETGEEIPALNPLSEPQKLVGKCTDRILKNNAIYNSSVMVRREAIDSVGMCDIKISGNTVADLDLWIRISRIMDLGFIAEPLTIYRTHPQQGLLDRRSMLTAELKLLENIPIDLGWESQQAKTQKIAELNDQLAVAWLDAGDVKTARKYFSQSIKQKATLRNVTCAAATFLPKPVLNMIRG